jgi:ESS family glutamate:Na+ symporter
MSKVSDFAFDLMIIAGVAAIDIENIANYIWVIVVLCIVGTLVTFAYVKIMTKICFKDNRHDMFLVNFGTLTGTASNGMILLRESDPHFQRESASIFIVSQLPAMIAVAPLLLMLNFSAKSLTSCLIAMGIFFLLAIIYTTVNLIICKKQKSLDSMKEKN